MHRSGNAPVGNPWNHSPQKTLMEKKCRLMAQWSRLTCMIRVWRTGLSSIEFLLVSWYLHSINMLSWKSEILSFHIWSINRPGFNWPIICPINQSINQSINQWMGSCISFQSFFLPDPNVELNPVAAFIGLLRKLLSRNPELQEDIMQLNTLAVTGHLLTKVEERFLDVNLLVALQLLIEAAQGSHVWVDFLAQVYQHLLFDLKIWAKAEFTVRLGHLQYIRKLVKEDKKAFRKKFGVQLFLDSLRVYGTKNCALAATLSEEEGDILRRHTLGIIQEFISHNVSHTEISALIAFLLTVKCERTVDDVLQLILTVTYVIFLEWSFGWLMSDWSQIDWLIYVNCNSCF